LGLLLAVLGLLLLAFQEVLLQTELVALLELDFRFQFLLPNLGLELFHPQMADPFFPQFYFV